MFASGVGTLGVVVLLGVGVIGLFVGVAWWRRGSSSRSPAWSAGPAAAPAASAGELASANSVRNPSRTASTAAALMIGLTLVTVVAVLGAGLRSSVEGAVTDQVKADYILDLGDNLSFGAAEGDTLANGRRRDDGLARPHGHGAGRRARRPTSPASTRRRSTRSTRSTG